MDGRSCRSAAASWVDNPTGVGGVPHISRSSELATLTNSLVRASPIGIGFGRDMRDPRQPAQGVKIAP